ncbi:restriction endonuclease subunit S [Vibrio campbellii]
MTGRYKAYPEYKNSELKWLGFVPTSWTVSKFAYLKTVLTDYTANGSFADLKKNVTYLDEPDFARLVRLTDLRRNLDNDGVWIDETSYKYLSKSALFGGEFLLANVGAYAGLFYQMPCNKGLASLAPNMFMAKFDSSKVLPDFMAYVGQSDPINKQLTLSATASSAQPKLNKDDFKSIRFCYPSLIEQQKIANFLDHETAKIDTLITKQEKLIELLKEKRQAVISHAVTKGLNPDAPMKDSGVEWLGEVPEHWSLCSIKYLCREITDGAHISPDLKEGVHHFVSIKDIKNGEINFDDSLLTSEESYHYLVKTGCMPFEGDILFSKDGTIGQTAITPANKDFVVASSLIIIRPNLEKVSSEYLDLMLQSSLVKEQVESFVKGAALRRLSIQNLLKVFGLRPPLNEQKKIAEYVNLQLSKFSTLEDKAQKQVQLLQERKTALISAAVTGKIDVRDWSQD